MKLTEITPAGQGRYIHRYDLHYTLNAGGKKIYEMVSRAPLQSEADLPGPPADGVVMIVLNRSHTKVLLNREFRPAVGMAVYNFPAGLMEPGETPEAAALRELGEETGLKLEKTLAVYGRSYGAVGLSNESAAVLVGEADDTAPFAPHPEAAEEIDPLWVDKQTAAALVDCGEITARVQLFLALWAGALTL